MERVDLSQEIKKLQTRMGELEKLIEEPELIKEEIASIQEKLSEFYKILREKPTQPSIHVALQSRLGSEAGSYPFSREDWSANAITEEALVCRFNLEGAIIFANEAFRQNILASRDSPLGENFFAVLTEEERLRLNKHLESLSPENPVRTVETNIRKRDGETGWRQWSLLGIFDAQGRLAEAQSITSDISQRKQIEIEAEQRTRQLQALHNATLALLSTLDLEMLLGSILDSVSNAIPAAEKGMVHLVAKDTGELEMRASRGYDDPRIRRISSSASIGYVAKSVREQKPLLFDDLHGDNSLRYNGSIPEARAVRSAVVAPLILEGRVLGALSLDSSHRSAFKKADLLLLESFAATATAVIRNAQLHAEVQKLAITDPLTGLYNRRGFFELGRREVERAIRFQRPLTAIMLDIDFFKFVNDTFGHSAGDHVLKILAECCARNIREVDLLGRYGGEEFAILLPETGTSAGYDVAERLRYAVANLSFPTPNGFTTISISLGVAGVYNGKLDLSILLRNADEAMYAAKQAGRNRVRVWSE